MTGAAGCPWRRPPSCSLLSFAKTPSRQAVGLSALSRRQSPSDDQHAAPPASTLPVPLRRPPAARHRESRVAPAVLAVYKRTAKRPKLRRRDRLFWVWLARVWAGWKEALVIVDPDTVLRWQGRRFRVYRTKISGRPTVGRPPVNAEIKAPRDRARAWPRRGCASACRNRARRSRDG